MFKKGEAYFRPQPKLETNEKYNESFTCWYCGKVVGSFFLEVK